MQKLHYFFHFRKFAFLVIISNFRRLLIQTLGGKDRWKEIVSSSTIKKIFHRERGEWREGERGRKLWVSSITVFENSLLFSRIKKIGKCV